jgi:hypothetical protein
MDGINDGGPAFPHRAIAHYVSDGKSGAEPVFTTEGGMTLRDWFAGQALAGMVPEAAKNKAEAAYAIADAMLAERSKSGAK